MLSNLKPTVKIIDLSAHWMLWSNMAVSTVPCLSGGRGPQ